MVEKVILKMENMGMMTTSVKKQSIFKDLRSFKLLMKEWKNNEQRNILEIENNVEEQKISV